MTTAAAVSLSPEEQILEGLGLAPLNGLATCPACERPYQLQFSTNAVACFSGCKSPMVVDRLAALGRGAVGTGVKILADAWVKNLSRRLSWPTLAERALGLGRRGDPIPMGIHTIDGATRGGLRPGVIAFAGPPGAGKTTWVVWLALLWALRGIHVSILAADEGADGLLIRLGQALGFDRADLENGEPETLRALAARLAEVPRLAIVDATESGAVIEDVAGDLLGRRADGEQAILLVDSIQRARAQASDLAEGPRAAVDAVMASLRRAARDGLVVGATSEVSRGAYRSRDPGDRIDSLAAAKESGAIEYGVDLLLALRSVRGEPGIVDVEVPKNRWGIRPEFRLAIDPDRASVSEVPLPDDETGAPLTPEDLLETDMAAARAVLRAQPGIAGYDRLRAAMGGMSMARRHAAVRSLREGGEIVDRGTRQQPRLHLRDPDPALTLPGSTRPTVGRVSPSPTALPAPIGVGQEGRAAPVDLPEMDRSVGPGGEL